MNSEFIGTCWGSEPETVADTCGHGVRFPFGDAPEEWCDQCRKAYRLREFEANEGYELRGPEDDGRP